MLLYVILCCSVSVGSSTISLTQSAHLQREDWTRLTIQSEFVGIATQAGHSVVEEIAQEESAQYRNPAKSLFDSFVGRVYTFDINKQLKPYQSTVKAGSRLRVFIAGRGPELDDPRPVFIEGRQYLIALKSIKIPTERLKKFVEIREGHQNPLDLTNLYELTTDFSTIEWKRDVNNSSVIRDIMKAN